MRRLFPLSIAFLLLFALGCSEDSPTSARVFTNSLTLGTGYRGIDLTGATNTFSITHGQNADINPTIYWRAESESKMRSAYVDLKVELLGEVGPEQVYTTRYEMVQMDDYVAISSYYHMYGVGKFRATATLGSEKVLLGVMEFTVK